MSKKISEYPQQSTLLDTDVYVLEDTVANLTKRTPYSALKTDIVSSIVNNLEKTITSSTYTVTLNDFLYYTTINFDTTSTGIVVTLPDRATCNGYTLILNFLTKASTNTVTVNRAGADTITGDSLTSILLYDEDNFIKLLASDTDSRWEILEERIKNQFRCTSYSGYSSTYNKIPYFYSTEIDINGYITGYNTSVLGCYIDINRTGNYSITYMFSADASNQQTGSLVYTSTGIDLTNATTSVTTLISTDMHLIKGIETAEINHIGCITYTGWLKAGSSINPQTDGVAMGTISSFEITYLGQG